MYVILTHLGAAAISFVFQTVAFWYFIGRNGFKEILGIVFTIIYAGMIYHNVRKLSVRDYKSYTPLKPSVFKGVMFGVCISLITLALFIMWKLVWINCSDDSGLVGGVAHICNVVFTFWTFPFFGLLGASEGNLTLFGQIIMYIVPILASTAGYLSGTYNIDLADKLQMSIYEKNQEED
jgi:hypothetical protein